MSPMILTPNHLNSPFSMDGSPHSYYHSPSYNMAKPGSPSDGTSAPSPQQAPSTMTSSFALTKRPRTTRAKFPKVRTGCITCKKRHVKCDETKPSCTRCLKWRGVCSGYEPQPNRSSHTPERGSEGAHMSASTSEPRMSMESGSSPQSQPMNLPRSTSMPACGDYVIEGLSPPQAYTPGTGDDSSMFEASFWSETVPRLVEINSAVRLANEAVHILILAKQPSLMASSSSASASSAGVTATAPGAEPTSGEDHYSGALRRYGTALSEVRRTSIMQGDARPAILCSMFFVIFEIINGDQAAAEAHLSMGQRMFDELQGVTTGSIFSAASSGPPVQTRSLRKELKHVLRFLALQARSHGVVRWEREMRRETDSWHGGLDRNES